MTSCCLRPRLIAYCVSQTLSGQNQRRAPLTLRPRLDVQGARPTRLPSSDPIAWTRYTLPAAYLRRRRLRNSGSGSSVPQGSVKVEPAGLPLADEASHSDKRYPRYSALVYEPSGVTVLILESMGTAGYVCARISHISNVHDSRALRPIQSLITPPLDRTINRNRLFRAMPCAVRIRSTISIAPFRGLTANMVCPSLPRALVSRFQL